MSRNDVALHSSAQDEKLAFRQLPPGASTVAEPPVKNCGTLWLHVGTHKTGTTSIQHALRLRKDALGKAGVHLHAEENAWKLANVFIRPRLRTTPRVRNAARPVSPSEFAKALSADFWKLEGQDMIISSEEFCLLRETLEAHALASTLGQRFSRIVPIIALRNEADWRESRRDQLRKTGIWEIQKSLSDAESTDGEWYYDREALLAFWQSIGPVRVIDYDTAVETHGSVLPAFAMAIDQPGVFDGLDLRLNKRSEMA